MPRSTKPAPNPEHDPALVAAFGRSRKSYERNRDELLDKLEAAAQRTRSATALKTAVTRRAVVIEDLGSPEIIQVRTPQKPLADAGATVREKRQVKA